MKTLQHGIYCLDAQYIQPGVAALYLLVHAGKICIIETGTSRSLPGIIEAIESLNMSLDDVAYVIPTHIHLDHAGGAGALMQACPHAKLIIHPRGAAHMINPEKLIAGTRQVYGDDAFERLYGEIVPIAEHRVIIADDGFTLDVSGRELKFIDTPGHALHHFCVIDEMSSGIFTGDTFGIAYPTLTTDNGPYIFATTTPTHFDPDALLHSIERIIEHKPRFIYLTHFGEIELNASISRQLQQSVKNQADIALGMKDQTENREQHLETALNRLFVDTILAQGGHESVAYYQKQFTADARLNAQGLNVWLARLEKKQA